MVRGEPHGPHGQELGLFLTRVFQLAGEGEHRLGQKRWLRQGQSGLSSPCGVAPDFSARFEGRAELGPWLLKRT